MYRVAAVAAALSTTAFAAGAITTGASAAPPANLHCPDHRTETKVELGGDVKKLKLADGTVFCIKAGRGNTGVLTVGEDIFPNRNGYITNPLTNKRGKPLGISYYVIYEEPDCPYGESGCPGY